jgi:hypothetical protein
MFKMHPGLSILIIIFAGLIIFDGFDGRGWCLMCLLSLKNILGLGLIGIGIAGLINRFTSNPMPG